MESSSSPNYNKALIGELKKGRDYTKKLQNLLRRNNHNDSAEDLVVKILRSFSDSLSMLTCCTSGDSYSVSACSSDRILDSGESKKKPAPVVKDRRGCYTRRKTENSMIKIVDRIEDGFAWRKYGQRKILNAKYPRCTHKTEGCKALKQAQKLEDGSEKFHVIYIGHHTCQNGHQNTQTFSDSGDLSFFLLNFDYTKINNSSSLSSITNVQNTPLVEHEDAQSGDLVAFNTNHGQSWKDMIGDLGPSYEELFNNEAYPVQKLLNLLRRNILNDSAEDLVIKILRSFSDSLSVLTSGDSYPVSACSGDRKLNSNILLVEQEDDSNAQSGEHVAFNTNHGQSSIPIWKDMVGDPGSSHEEFFNNGDYLGGGFYV
ncbi:hypothetical protein OSB04_025918 [Centaurea solstitialis]|uniref:WRKY domain-containing protein n=1 Tax=Centaurea solstitialis TaxID=347529 RepID=A0AA38T2D0_9ASTR|nr:hypothetical protein OSB04_025918 [Centaurea solstitialis]